jgi:hypothetical protein
MKTPLLQSIFPILIKIIVVKIFEAGKIMEIFFEKQISFRDL